MLLAAFLDPARMLAPPIDHRQRDRQSVGQRQRTAGSGAAVADIDVEHEIGIGSGLAGPGADVEVGVVTLHGAVPGALLLTGITLIPGRAGRDLDGVGDRIAICSL